MMENKFNLQELDLQELNYSEIITIDGGGSGSESGAYWFGKAVRFAAISSFGPVGVVAANIDLLF